MFWEEKIDALKRIYTQEQFRVPFTTWPGILKKIEDKFIIKDWSQLQFVLWSGNLKQETPIKTLPWHALDQEISNLVEDSHYWVIFVLSSDPTSPHYLYDCQPLPMRQLVSMAPADFYIVDKRYNWLTYFKVDRKRKEVLLLKSGNGPTPFDRQ